MIKFKEVDSDSWCQARVFGVFKRTSKYKNYRQLELLNRDKVEKDFESDIVDWEVLPSENEINAAAFSKTNEVDEIDTLYSDAQDNVMFGVQVIPKAEWTTAEVKDTSPSR